MTVTATHVGLVGVGVGAKVGAIVRRICAGVEFNFAPRPVRKILGRSEVYGGARSITVDNVTRLAVGTEQGNTKASQINPVQARTIHVFVLLY